MEVDRKKIIRNFVIELMIYGILVTIYFIVVLNQLEDWLLNLYETGRTAYVFVACGLLSKLIGLPITLMTVVDNGTDEVDTENWMSATRELLDAPEVTIKIRKGMPLKQILKESRSIDHEMVFVCTRELKFLEALLGTLTKKVTDKSDKSMRVVKHYRTAVRMILVAVGGQSGRKGVVKAGERLAKKAAATLTVLHVAAPVPSMYTGLELIEETLSEMLHAETPIAQFLRWSARYMDEQGVTGDIQLRHGAATDEIVREARIGDYDLLVIGVSQAMGPLRRLIVEPIAPHIIERSPCSIVTVP